MDWPEQAVYEIAACWAIKHLTHLGKYVPNDTIKRIKVLVGEFFKDVGAVDSRLDYGPDGKSRMYFSSYEIHPLSVAYIAAYEKAYKKCDVHQPVKVKYSVLTKLNCPKIGSFYPIIGVELETIRKEQNDQTQDYIEPFQEVNPWEYFDPDTGEKYEIARDKNGCSNVVKKPHPGERFLPYI
ncbi:MAG: hypothetical protein ACXVIG_06790 [Halobacteriota archaeon]